MTFLMGFLLVGFFSFHLVICGVDDFSVTLLFSHGICIFSRFKGFECPLEIYLLQEMRKNHVKLVCYLGTELKILMFSLIKFSVVVTINFNMFKKMIKMWLVSCFYYWVHISNMIQTYYIE